MLTPSQLKLFVRETSDHFKGRVRRELVEEVMVWPNNTIPYVTNIPQKGMRILLLLLICRHRYLPNTFPGYI